MSKIAWLRQRIQLVVPLIIFVLIAVIWFNYYNLGFSHFNKSNAVSIFGSVIQGMSALLSVAIAVIIFRIQSLENRNQSLEQTTLNHVYEIVNWSYAEWDAPLELDIRNKSITDRYYQNRLELQRQGRLPWTKEELEKDRDKTQKRLEGNLSKHDGTKRTIQRIRNGVFSSVVFLIMPILFSFLLLMVSDALDASYNFVFVSIVVLMSAMGIVSLIKMVLDSTVQNQA
jgi:hypothetical protein